ncbi:heme-binding domain-containing protein [Echinicola marina]|uniref:heme-binding domain-containing protein n=1 Tax=Echinicola marina TaxID=2859768 RepID=UPI001CF631E2|nr:heme-binding domain-containing protein [Echinicola marina]UCS94927.1 heme-binding domain-containing protein [Echinicola marina]
MIKKILLGLIAALIIIQFIRPEKNISNAQPAPMSAEYAIPENVQGILNKACTDCHSNTTEYPWYSNIQPVSWWLDGHIKDGKRHLNFDDFTTLPIARQNHKLEEIIEVIEEGEMPLKSYTALGLHSEAQLSEAEKNTLMSWAKEQMDMLKENYPADSLVMKRRPRPQEENH